MIKMEKPFQIAQKMQEFEDLEPIEVSANWETELDIKLRLAQANKRTTGKKYSALIALMLLVNITFMFILSIKKQEKAISKNDDYQKLTNELLITSRN